MSRLDHVVRRLDGDPAEVRAVVAKMRAKGLLWSARVVAKCFVDEVLGVPREESSELPGTAKESR